MKKTFAFAYALFVVVSLTMVLSSCDKEDEILPTVNVKMYEESLFGERTLLDSMTTHVALTLDKNGLLLVTGTTVSISDPEGYIGQKLIIYLNKESIGVGTFNISFDISALLSMNIKDILKETVVYQDANKENYLLMNGAIEITEKGKNSIKGTFSGSVIPANLLDGNISWDVLAELMLSKKKIEGDFKVYGLSF